MMAAIRQGFSTIMESQVQEEEKNAYVRIESMRAFCDVQVA
jgi:hypothetical protein